MAEILSSADFERVYIRTSYLSMPLHPADFEIACSHLSFPNDFERASIHLNEHDVMILLQYIP